jgi:hypothetical protein
LVDEALISSIRGYLFHSLSPQDWYRNPAVICVAS